MMHEINFLPWRSQWRRRYRRRFYFCSVLTITLMLVLQWHVRSYLYQQQVTQQKRVDYLIAQQKTLREKIDKLQHLSHYRDTLQRKGKYLHYINWQANQVTAFSNFLERIVPEQVLLTQVGLQQHKVHLQGKSISTDSITQMMDTINHSAGILQGKLHYIRDKHMRNNSGDNAAYKLFQASFMFSAHTDGVLNHTELKQEVSP